MATAVLIRTVTFTEKLYGGHGMVRVWLDRITTRFGQEAKHYAPVRTGRLRAQISTSTRRTGRHSCAGTIASKAPYTMWVLRGTTSPIMSDTAWGAALDSLRRDDGSYPPGTFMPIPAWGPYAARTALVVSGQSANNFLLKAWVATARDHRAIRGKAVPSFIANP